MVHCHSCNRIIMDSTSDGGYKLRSRMVLFHEGVSKAICPSCKAKVEVPIQLGDVAPPTRKPIHVINKKL